MPEPILLANLRNFIKKEARTQIFSCKLIEILENIYFEEDLRTAACQKKESNFLKTLNPERKTSFGKERHKVKVLDIFNLFSQHFKRYKSESCIQVRLVFCNFVFNVFLHAILFLRSFDPYFESMFIE